MDRGGEKRRSGTSAGLDAPSVTVALDEAAEARGIPDLIGAFGGGNS